MPAKEESRDWPYLERYSNTPMYNTKAVVQQTGIPAPTLRAWERRYALISPERAENDYRLYSERDIALIRWLKERIESGMSISQAVALYRHRNQEQQNHDQYDTEASTVEETPEETPAFQVAVAPPTPRPEQTPDTFIAIEEASAAHLRDWNMSAVSVQFPTGIQDITAIQDRLIEAFRHLDEPAANMLMGTLLTVYPLEQVCEGIIIPTLWRIGQYWAEGKLTVSVEHFASNFFRALLTNLFHITPAPCNGPLIIACCAPGEPHELPPLILALFLRRCGERVAYLGQSIETLGLLHTIRQLSPALICVSMTLSTNLMAFITMARQINQLQPHPIVVFGGQGFQGYENIIAQIPGTYCANGLRESARKICQMLRQWPAGDKPD